MDNTTPTQTENSTTNTVKPKNKSKAKLIIVLCSIIFVAIILVVLIVILSNRSQDTPTNQPSNQNVVVDFIPECNAEITETEPFASLRALREEPTDFDIYETASPYLCNAELGYAVKIPENISRVFYILASGGDIYIVGLEVDGELMTTSTSPDLVLIDNASSIVNTSQEIWDELQADSDNTGIYTQVLDITTNETIEVVQGDETDIESAETIPEEVSQTTTILYVKTVDPAVFENEQYATLISAEDINQMKEAYANRNQALSDIVDEVFGNPENYLIYQTGQE